MPGHKGRGGNTYDITEIPGADELFSPSGIIRESEENASSLFGTARTLYSTEGSSLCIRAMLFLTKQYAAEKGKRPLILAARNAHKSFINAAAVLDIDIEWLFSEEGNLLTCKVDCDRLDKKLKEFSPAAVYITSPDYLGNVSDVGRISESCKKHGTLLLVDNAHGAYLKFMPESTHPIDLGANICCDSAHKTLPVLTGGAYLHISKSAPLFFSENAKEAMALFATTSPSYLILRSLDEANRLLSENFSEKLKKLSERVSLLRGFLLDEGFDVLGDETTKITVAPKSFGYTGEKIAELLLSENIVCEAYDRDFVVMMFSVNTTARDFTRIQKAFSRISKRKATFTPAPSILPAKIKMSPHNALFSPKERVSVDDSPGRVFAGASLSCPPAIPICIYGEEIDENAVACMKYYGITECEVVK